MKQELKTIARQLIGRAQPESKSAALNSDKLQSQLAMPRAFLSIAVSRSCSRIRQKQVFPEPIRAEAALFDSARLAIHVLQRFLEPGTNRTEANGFRAQP